MHIPVCRTHSRVVCTDRVDVDAGFGPTTVLGSPCCGFIDAKLMQSLIPHDVTILEIRLTTQVSLSRDHHGGGSSTYPRAPDGQLVSAWLKHRYD